MSLVVYKSKKFDFFLRQTYIQFILFNDKKDYLVVLLKFPLSELSAKSTNRHDKRSCCNRVFT